MTKLERLIKIGKVTSGKPISYISIQIKIGEINSELHKRITSNAQLSITSKNDT